MGRNLFAKVWVFIFALGAPMLLISCITTSGTSGQQQSFTPDFSSNTVNTAALSPEQQMQQRELEGYVARTSSRSVMRLPKDLDLTLSGALKTPRKVEFIEPELEYQSHMYPYRMTNYQSTINYRPVFNDKFNVSPSIR